MLLASIAVASMLACVGALADDLAAFLSGASRNCIACDLSGRDLKARAQAGAA